MARTTFIPAEQVNDFIEIHDSLAHYGSVNPDEYRWYAQNRHDGMTQNEVLIQMAIDHEKPKPPIRWTARRRCIAALLFAAPWIALALLLGLQRGF
jgi:hypothetical protein